jgi:arylformamidase
LILDITPAITPALAVWPGDTPASREVLMDLSRGDVVTLSTLHATVHLGAHADAPSHYGRDAATIDAMALDRYVGRCRVLRVPSERGTRIAPERIPADLRAERVLLATGTYPDPERWNDDFAALDPRTVDLLRERGARLVGIDTPSVDLKADKELLAHRRFLANDMAILEGLVLDHVAEGEYELIALPLKLVGFDASPVRAVLRTL